MIQKSLKKAQSKRKSSKQRLFKLKFLLLCFIVLYLHSYNIVYADTRTFLETRFSQRQGLPQSQVTCIIQGKRDMLWVGTLYGLARYDGYDFKNYFSRNGLSSSIIFDLGVDSAGKIWISTSNGITSFDGQSFKSYLSLDGRFITVSDIYISPDDIVYFISENEWGKVEGESLKFIHLPVTNKKYNFLSICGDGRGRFFLGTVYDGLLIVEKDGAKISSVKLSESGSTPSISTLLWDNENDCLWIGTSNGLFKLKNGKYRNIDNIPELSRHQINSIIKEREGGILFSVSELGIYKIIDDKASLLIRSPVEQHINDCFQDNNGNIWVGYDGRGISRFSESIFTNITTDSGIFDGFPMAFFEDSKGKYWIGTVRSGVYRFDSINDTHPDHIYNYAGYGGNGVRGLVEMKDGSIWFATEDGVVRLKNRKYTVFHQSDGLTHNYTRNFLLDHKGVLWISTNDGITLYSNGRFQPFKYNDKFIHKMIREVIQDKDNNYWIATFGGLYFYDGKDLVRYRNGEAPFGDPLETIYIDSRNNLWLGAIESLSVLKNNGEIRTYTQKDGFNSNTVFFIIEGGYNDMWIGTEKGIQTLYDRETDFILYNSENGLAGDECDARACMKDKQGNLWFGTISGISITNYLKTQFGCIDPPIYIEDFTADEKPVDRTQPIELSYNVQNIVFRYHVVCLSPETRLKYTIKLSGSDSGWSQPTSERYIRYTYLKPGSYTFMVSIYPMGNLKPTKVAAISFSIIPPIWMQLWFRVLLAFVMIGVFALVILNHIHRLNREKKALEEAVRERTKALEEKNKELESFAYTVSHDLKDPVGVIVGYITVLEDIMKKKRNKDSNQILLGIRRNSKRIIDLIDNLLRLSRSGKVIEKFVETDTGLIVRQIRRELIDKYKLKDNFIKIGNMPVIRADADRLYLVFQNILTNAVKYRSQERDLQIEISHEKINGYHLFSIKDNGIGIKESDLERIFDTSVRLHTLDIEGTGFGLQIVKKIIQAHSGKVWAESRFGEGSTIKFTIAVVGNEASVKGKLK